MPSPYSQLGLNGGPWHRYGSFSGKTAAATGTPLDNELQYQSIDLGPVQIRSRTRSRKAEQQSILNTQIFGPMFEVSGVQYQIRTATTSDRGVVLQGVAVTDSSGITDSTGGTPGSSVSDVSTAVTGVDGTGNNAASKSDVDTRLGGINDNFSSLAVKVDGLSDKMDELLASMRTAGLIDS